MVNLKKGFILQFHITERCNLRCKHCYQNDKYLNEELTISKKKNIIDMFGKAMEKWGLDGIINFTGGEPILKKDELLELIRYSKKNYPDISIGILSNGTLVDAQLAKELKDSGVEDVQVSLDGCNDETHDFIRGKGNFRKSLSGIKNIVDAGLLGEIMFTLNRANYKEVEEVIDLALKLKAKRIGIERMVPIGRGNKELPNSVLTPNELREIYLKIGKKKKEMDGKIVVATNRPLWCLIGDEMGDKDNFIGACAAGLSTITVLPNGDVMPCRRMDLVIGNLRDQTFFDIWYSSDVLWKLREREKNLEGCKDCENLNVCGGCRAVALGVTGNYLAKDTQCWKK